MQRFFYASASAWIVRVIVATLVITVGLWVKHRIDVSYEADALKDKVSAYTYMFAHERERRLAAERATRETLRKLVVAEAEIAERAKNAVTKAKGLVPKSSACDYNDDVVGVLNRARGYDF